MKLFTTLLWLVICLSQGKKMLLAIDYGYSIYLLVFGVMIILMNIWMPDANKLKKN